MATPARLVGVGVFVVVAVLLFAIGLFMIGDRQMAFAKKFSIYTEFSKITGLQPGAIIRVSGARAGTVKDIQVPNSPSGKFRVELEVAESLHPLIRTDSVASIMTEGLVGGSYLGIATGSDQAPRAAPGSTIPSREPFEIADLLQSMSDTITKVNTTIDQMSDDIERTIQTVAQTVGDADNLISSVTDDVKTIASSGARISGDMAEITDSVRNGRGTVGKLFTDDELYRRAAAVAKNAEQISSDAQQLVAKARQTLDSLQSKNGPAAGLTSDLKQTLDDARQAMAGFAENMQALKHNFLFRGFFNDRGYYDLSSISPAEYRGGVLTRARDIRPVRVWLGADVLFEPATPDGGVGQLSDEGKARLNSAIAPFLNRVGDGVLMIEGYAQTGTEDQRFVVSRARATAAANYLIGKFQLRPDAVGVVPLGADSAGSPGDTPWNGVALAFFLEKEPPRRGK